MGFYNWLWSSFSSKDNDGSKDEKEKKDGETPQGNESENESENDQQNDTSQQTSETINQTNTSTCNQNQSIQNGTQCESNLIIKDSSDVNQNQFGNTDGNNNNMNTRNQPINHNLFIVVNPTDLDNLNLSPKSNQNPIPRTIIDINRYPNEMIYGYNEMKEERIQENENTEEMDMYKMNCEEYGTSREHRIRSSPNCRKYDMRDGKREIMRPKETKEIEKFRKEEKRKERMIKIQSQSKKQHDPKRGKEMINEIGIEYYPYNGGQYYMYNRIRIKNKKMDYNNLLLIQPNEMLRRELEKLARDSELNHEGGDFQHFESYQHQPQPYHQQPYSQSYPPQNRYKMDEDSDDSDDSEYD